MGFGCCDQVAQRRIRTLTKGTECFNIDVCTFTRRSTFERTSIIYDICHGIDDGLHWTQYTRRGVTPSSNEQTVDCRNKRGDVNVEDPTIWRDR